ncbi:hypothetical protein PanWU01x14_204350 [Parasponia andersonii]|uniref:Uncharacterized protein n=1 Tax=Parasponia andersonii TaxID=3476 RepID=A0A2P5BW79_PARAD|nr:hypothetical protein PanWU01x14_204350 [Parasponia andersonii]
MEVEFPPIHDFQDPILWSLTNSSPRSTHSEWQYKAIDGGENEDKNNNNNANGSLGDKNEGGSADNNPNGNNNSSHGRPEEEDGKIAMTT